MGDVWLRSERRLHCSTQCGRGCFGIVQVLLCIIVPRQHEEESDDDEELEQSAEDDEDDMGQGLINPGKREEFRSYR